MDYISREAAIQSLGGEPEIWYGNDPAENQENADWHYYKEALEAVPAADVVPVVYCKDCINRMFSDCYMECSRGYLGIVEPDDFCSRGARREE